MRTQSRRISPYIFSVLSIGLASLSTINGVRAEFWYETFTDGNMSDSGLEWRFVRDHSDSLDGLLLSTDSSCCLAAVVPDWVVPVWPADRAGWSIRTQGRLLQNHGFFGVGTSPSRLSPDSTWTLLAANGDAMLGSGEQRSGIVKTDLRPFEKDVIVQLDTLDGVMRMWLWRDGDPPPEAPLIEEDFDLPISYPHIWLRSNDGPSSGLFRWAAFSTEHMPLDMPVPLSDLIGDFSGNDILDIADIDLLAAAIRDHNVHPQFDVNRNGIVDQEDHAYWVSDLKHTWMGDADLDGNVNFADFVTLANHFDGPGGWGQGDFNADGIVQFPDFAILASNYGMTSTAVAVAVPEPCSSVLLMIGFLLRLVARRAAADR